MAGLRPGGAVRQRPNGKTVPGLKRLKRASVVAAAGFFAFAPPGTLVLLAVLAPGMLGGRWLLAGLGAVAAIAALWAIRKAGRRIRSSNACTEQEVQASSAESGRWRS